MEQPNQQQPNAKGLDPKVVDVMSRLNLAAMKIVFDPTVSQQLLDMMRHGQPVQATARAALQVLGQLQEKSKGLPPPALPAAAPLVVGFLLQLADAAKLFQVNPQIMTQAVGLVRAQLGQQQQQPAPSAPAQGQPAAPAESGQGLINSKMGA